MRGYDGIDLIHDLVADRARLLLVDPSCMGASRRGGQPIRGHPFDQRLTASVRLEQTTHAARHARHRRIVMTPTACLGDDVIILPAGPYPCRADVRASTVTTWHYGLRGGWPTKRLHNGTHQQQAVHRMFVEEATRAVILTAQSVTGNPHARPSGAAGLSSLSGDAAIEWWDQ